MRVGYPFPIMRLGCSYHPTGVGRYGPQAADGYSLAVVPPPPIREVQVRCSDLCSGRLRLPCNSPHEARQSSSDCSASYRRSFSSCCEQALSSRQSALSFPRDLSECRRGSLQVIQLPHAQLRWMPVRPGTPNKHVSNSSIASLGHCASSYGLSRGLLASDETEIAHQLSWAFKAGHVTDFRGEGDSDNQIDAAQHLQGSNNLAKRQFGTNSSIIFSGRSTHSFEMRTASTISCSAT